MGFCLPGPGVVEDNSAELGAVLRVLLLLVWLQVLGQDILAPRTC